MKLSGPAREMLDAIQACTAHARYVVSEDRSQGCVFGYVGMGETMGRRLSDEELNILRLLLAEGLCALGESVDFVSSDFNAKGVDPDTGMPYHQDLRVHGRLLQPSRQPGNA